MPTMPNTTNATLSAADAAKYIPQRKVAPGVSSQPPPVLPRRRRRLWVRPWWLAIPFLIVLLTLCGVFSGIGLLRLAHANTILPSIQVGQIVLGGLTAEQAEVALLTEWQTIDLRADDQVIAIPPSTLGIALDARATATAAFAEGHDSGSLRAIFAPVLIEPVMTIDTTRLRAELMRLAPQFGRESVNAGVRFNAGVVEATAPQNGTSVDILASVDALLRDPGALLADGTFELIMQPVAPAIRDAAPLIAQAQQLIAQPLQVRVYDPVSDETFFWVAESAEWTSWLLASVDSQSADGLSLTADADAVQTWLSMQTLGADRSFDMQTASETIIDAIQRRDPDGATVIVEHLSRAHIVQAGESLTSIAWEYGIPYLYIQAVNGGIESLAVGQSLTIPPADAFLLKPIVPSKRIVVSLSEQRTRLYENGALIRDWASSTGINSSPTWNGIYQVISHEPNAYAGNWDLYMPNFVGVYQPVPGAAFTNGFHGFPTRGGGQLLWENSLGRRVTYGCILLNDENSRFLYDWADEGVVVEIRR